MKILITSLNFLFLVFTGFLARDVVKVIVHVVDKVIYGSLETLNFNTHLLILLAIEVWGLVLFIMIKYNLKIFKHSLTITVVKDRIVRFNHNTLKVIKFLLNTLYLTLTVWFIWVFATYMLYLFNYSISVRMYNTSHVVFISIFIFWVVITRFVMKSNFRSCP
jgi:hypothetical protein